MKWLLFLILKAVEERTAVSQVASEHGLIFG
jgi:hypothetical protein